MIKLSKNENNKYNILPNVESNEGQTRAIDLMIDFLNDKNETEFLLKGAAGTGKTTILKKVLENYNSLCCGSAYSHKAKKVLHESIGDEVSDVRTIASLLAIKLDENTGEFKPDIYRRNNNDVPIINYNLIIIDECSMLSDELLLEVRSWKKRNGKIIFMGDSNQLPPVGQETDSKTFEIKNQFTLTEKMRQKPTSPIIKIGNVIVDNIENNLNDIENMVVSPITDDLRINISDEESNSSLTWLTDDDLAIDMFIKDYEQSNNDVNHVKLITYNNEKNKNYQSVGSLNKKVRNKMFGDSNEQFYANELLTAYDTFYDSNNEDVLFYNSDDLRVVSFKERKDVVGIITANSRMKGNREFKYKYDMVYLTLNDSQGKRILEQIPVIGKNSIEQFNKNITDLFKKDPQLGFILNSKFGNLHYGYCITVTKSQGSTYKNTYVFEDNILGKNNGASKKAKNQALYVATSRAKEKLVMISCKNEK